MTAPAIILDVYGLVTSESDPVDLNLAYGTVTGSGNHPPSEPASNANDGDHSTSTESPSMVGDGDYTTNWDADLGEARAVSAFVIYDGPGFTWTDLYDGTGGNNGQARVYWSDDGSAWTEFTDDITETQEPYAGFLKYTYAFATLTHRYWRVQVFRHFASLGFGGNISMNTWEIQGDPGTTTEYVHLARLDDAIDKAIRVVLNEEGSGAFAINRGSANVTEQILARHNLVRVSLPDIHSEPLFEFFLESGDFDLISSDEEGGENLRFGGPGSLAILRDAGIDFECFACPPWPASVVKADKGIWSWVNQEAGNILRRLVEEAQARGVLAQVTRTFTNTEDSDGVTWTPMGAWQVPIGSNLFDECMKLVAAGQLQIEMRPGLVLDAYQNIGTDRTSTTFGAGKVRFVRGVNIVEILGSKFTGGLFASDAVIRGGDGSYARASIADPPYKREIYLEVQSSDATVMQAAGEEVLGAREDAQDAILLQALNPQSSTNDEMNGIYLPGPDWSDNGNYWVGDLVTLHTGTGPFDHQNASKRVFAITLREDEAGALAAPIVEINAPFPRDDAEDPQSMLASGGGEPSGGGTGAHVHTQYTTEAEATLIADEEIAAASIDDLADVDTTTTPPADADVLTWDDYLQQWSPAAPAGGGVDVKEDNALVASAITLDFGTGLDVMDQGSGEVEVHVDPGEIKLDDLGVPDDNTDLDATTGRHGLLPKLGGGTATFLRADGSWAAPPGASGGDASGQFIVGWDGGGTAVATGTDQDVIAPFAGTITGWTLLADQSGSIVVDIWKDSYANFPPTVADTITASAKPTLSTARKAQGSPTGWTTAVTAGDVLRFHIDSASTIEKVLLVVDYSRP